LIKSNSAPNSQSFSHSSAHPPPQKTAPKIQKHLAASGFDLWLQKKSEQNHNYNCTLQHLSNKIEEEKNYRSFSSSRKSNNNNLKKIIVN
jgi:hypothetical protein